MRPSVVTLSAVGVSPAIPVSWKVNAQVACAVVISGAATAKIQATFDNVQDPLVTNVTWFDHPTATGTASFYGTYLHPIQAVRLNATAYTSGTVTMTVLSASY